MLFLSVVNSLANHERAKGTVMMDYSGYLEGYRDAQDYDVEEGQRCGLSIDRAVDRELGGPLLDLACGTGTMAVCLA